MCKRLVYLVVVLVLCLAGTPLSANTFIGAVNDDFMEAGNWDGGAPQFQFNIINGGHTVNLTAPTNYPIEPDYYDLGYIALGYDADTMNTLNYNGGGTYMAGDIYVGCVYGLQGEGTLNMNGGYLGFANLMTGNDNGVINVNGGTLYPWSIISLGMYSTSGTINLNGGLLRGSDFEMTAGHSVVVSDGVLQIDGYWGDPMLVIPQYIADGWIRPAPGYTLVTELINNDTGIIITAVPEPATIALLSIGGLFLRRRKR